MTNPSIAFALLAANVVLMFALIAGTSNAQQQPWGDVVRARSIELVDERGEVRGQLTLGEDGGGLLRLKGGNGEVRVKLGASAKGGGLLLLNQATEPGVQLSTDGKDASLTLTDADKRQRKITP